MRERPHDFEDLEINYFTRLRRDYKFILRIAYKISPGHFLRQRGSRNLYL